MSTRTIRHLVLGAAAAALLASPVAAFARPASDATLARTAVSSAPYCGIMWGSLPKQQTPLWTGAVTTARWGQHPCFDRLVLDISKGVGTLGYNVRYVSTVTSPGSGLPVAVSGGARLQVTVNAPAVARVPSSGSITFSGWRTFRQLRWVGSYEGYTDLGLGVRARLPMRTFVLSNPDGSKRLVIDVAHSW